jgi:hypothetical protein
MTPEKQIARQQLYLTGDEVAGKLASRGEAGSR